MREIKYKAYWHESKLMTSVDTIMFLQGGIAVSDGCSCDGFANDECTLIEFTGLKDSHGKEVYEGDILRCIFEVLEDTGLETAIDTGVVVFEDYGYKIKFPYDTQDDLASLYMASEEFEVVGNRFENPELLSGVLQ